MNILYVVHNISPKVPESMSKVIEGGCEKFTYNLAHGLSLENTCYILYPDLKDTGKVYLHKISYLRNELVRTYEYTSKFHKIHDFGNILDELEIDLIHYQHLIHAPIEYPVIAKAKGIKQIVTAHDYYYICDEHFLENDRYVPCDVPKEIGRCIECLYNKAKVSAENVIKRRDIMTTIVSLMDAFVVPSKAVRSDYFKIYPEINDRMHIVPIGVKHINQEEVPQMEYLHIGLPGYLTYIKGWVYIINVIRMCEKFLPKVKFVIQCDTMSENQERLLKQFSNVYFNTNKFSNINLTWISSIAKETFSLIASESILRGIPILCAKRGALATRLDERHGYMYESDATSEEVVSLIKGIVDDMPSLNSKIANMSEVREGIPLIDTSISQYKSIYQNVLTK